MRPKCTLQVSVSFYRKRSLTVEFSGGRISSDGGLLLLRQVDEREGLTRLAAAAIRERRRLARIRHSLRDLLRQRVYQIALGYEDCNDAETLRGDPLFKVCADRLPESGADLASQPTLSRLENSLRRGDLWRLSALFLERFIAQCRREGRTAITLDLDATDDPTHGQQLLSGFHGYYGQHMYHPLLLFDAESGELLSALLRPGRCHAGRAAVGMLRRVVERLHEALPHVALSLRADAGFALPALYEFCEEEQLAYTIGLIPNPRLERAGAALVEQARTAFAAGGEEQRRFTEVRYQADSWPRARRVIIKAEYSRLGSNTRFVVTSRADGAPQEVYDAYVQRGQAENYIKELKNGLAADRLSCHRFAANQARLLLYGLAYSLILALRRALRGTPLARAQVETLRRRLLKLGAWVSESRRRVLVRFASAFPLQPLFRLLARRLALPLPAT